MWQHVASSNQADLTRLAGYESLIAEGQRGKVSLILRMPAPLSLSQGLQDKLNEAGVLDAKVTADGKTLDIEFRKGLPWLAVIVAAVIGLTLLIILIVSWQLFKEIKEVVPEPIIIIGAVVVIALVAVLVFMLVRRQLPIGGA